MTARRLERVESRLAQRQPDLTVLLDGVHKPHNVAAIIRSCDAVGVMQAHVIPPEEGLRVPKLPAQGTRKWVSLVRHRCLADGLAAVRAAGCRLVAAHLDPAARDFREIDYTRPTAFVMGTEHAGVSAEALAACDDIAIIPMHGMVESLNVSVAAALLLFEAQRQRQAAGTYAERRIPDEDYVRLRFEWLHPQLARRYRERGEPYPAVDEDGDIVPPKYGR
ncbi:MAG: tRNA (guanosine(18)-2'-O)-methyltransferase TrmH [Pseudomonadota bacterium]